MLSRLEIEDKPFTQFILILTLCLVSVILFSIFGGVAAALFYDFDPSNINNLGDPKIIDGMKMFQLFSAFGLFVVPPIIYGIVTSKQAIQKLSLSLFPKPINYLLILALMVVLTPFLSWVIELNAAMDLPGFMSGIEEWMRSSENQAESLTKAFLTFDGVGSLMYVLLIVAVVPAVGEELLFRGVLQKIFINWSKNPHVGIWITAFLFSALHMQFFGFFPRMLLGLLFGYIFYWSKSLWLPILGHFFNNGSVVVASYFYPESLQESEVSLFGESENNVFLFVGSFIVSSAILFLIWKANQRSSHSELDTESHI